MDWTSEEGRALLRKAWPDGFLAKRGVRTVGGFETQEGSVERGLRFVPSARASLAARAVVGAVGISQAALGHSTFARFVDSGALLPLPDPEDTATWACLLQDLWDAAAVHRYMGPLRGLVWSGRMHGPEAGRRWSLTGHIDGRHTAGISWATSVEDPAEALVTVRGMLRAEGT